MDAELTAAAAWPEYPTAGDLTPEALREITNRHGIDTATALLHDRLVRAPERAAFMHRIAARVPDDGLKKRFRIVMVPGSWYASLPHTRADGSVALNAAQALGYESELVPVDETGTLANNADFLIDWLGRSDQPTILVSVSKGGADVKTALALAGGTGVFRRVVAWINLGGLLHGTPMAEWLLSWNPLAATVRLAHGTRGRSFSFLSDLRRGGGAPLDAPLRLPPGMRMISVAGFPLRRHLVKGVVRYSHRRLSEEGPNDGALILSDFASLPGDLYPVWGSDHYLRPEAEMAALFAALLGDITAGGAA